MVFRAVILRAMLMATVLAATSTAATSTAAIAIPAGTIAAAAVVVTTTTVFVVFPAALASSIACTGTATISSLREIDSRPRAGQQAVAIIVRVGEGVLIHGCGRSTQSLLDRARPHHLAVEPLCLRACETGSCKKKRYTSRNGKKSFTHIHSLPKLTER